MYYIYQVLRCIILVINNNNNNNDNKHVVSTHSSIQTSLFIYLFISSFFPVRIWLKKKKIEFHVMRKSSSECFHAIYSWSLHKNNNKNNNDRATPSIKSKLHQYT